MKIEGYAGSDTYHLNIGNLENVTLRRLTFEESRQIDRNLPLPIKPQREITNGMTGKKVLVDETDSDKLREYDEEYETVEELRTVAAVYYSFVDRKYNRPLDDRIAFDVKPKPPQKINERWAKNLLREISESINAYDYQQLVMQVRCYQTVNPDELDSVQNMFLKKKGENGSSDGSKKAVLMKDTPTNTDTGGLASDSD